MADPTPYEPSYNFNNFQTNSPATPLPAPQLDNELDNIASAVAELVAAVKDVRRSDGALPNNIVTFDSLALSLQLTFDPTNGELVAAAVLGAQESAAAALASQIAAANSAADALTQALAAAASAASVDLALYFPKAGNLAGVGSPDTARSNINAAKVDGSDMTGRLIPTTGGTVTDWNTVLTNGWFSGGSVATNAPNTSNFWLVQCIAYGPFFVTQIAYPIDNSSTSVDAVTPYRRHSYNNAGAIAWQPWQSMSPVPVGEVSFFPATTVPVGFLKTNGALLSRATFPALYAFAAASGNIRAEASWAANAGGFSTGDLSTTFRLPDLRGEFVRGLDDGRGVDSGRGIGSNQTDSLKDHTHSYLIAVDSGARVSGTGNILLPTVSATAATTGSPSTGAAAETRPRNIPLLACIKY